LIVREYFGYMDRRLTDHGFSGPSVEAATLSDRAGVDSETGNSHTRGHGAHAEAVNANSESVQKQASSMSPPMSPPRVAHHRITASPHHP
jgi:hypothetical protein